MREFKLDIDRSKTSRKNDFNLPELTAIDPREQDKNFDEESNTIKEKRKKRSDKKVDIKIPITIEQKQKIKVLARMESIKTGESVSVTQMASNLVQEGLIQYEAFPEIKYDPSLNPIHVKLTNFYAEQLFNYELEWDVSKRVAAARIFSYVLEKRVDHDKEI